MFSGRQESQTDPLWRFVVLGAIFRVQRFLAAMPGSCIARFDSAQDRDVFTNRAPQLEGYP